MAQLSSIDLAGLEARIDRILAVDPAVEARSSSTRSSASASVVKMA